MMISFWNSVIGLLMIIAGVFVFVWLTNKRIKGDKGGYGNHTQIYTSALGLIIVGFILLIRELIKL